ncbi:MAG: hypothetical protein SF051_07470 [Elusimicrobiota bacterium]|nr:hypothetical protein [Elusimicrobiota bacterium]
MLTRAAAFAVLLAGAVPAGAAARSARPVAPAPAVRLAVAPVVPSGLGLTPTVNLAPNPSSSLVVPNEAPKLADALRSQAAATVAEWRASRAGAAADAPAASPVGRTPALSAAEAIATAPTSDQALARLVGLGVIDFTAIPEGETDRVALLKRVWDGVSAELTAAVFPVDASWAVPAIKVERGGKTYLIHGVAHGQLYPPNRRQVAKLVAQIEKNGHALLSEQKLPVHYGFAYGLETMDHEVGETNGMPARVAEAAGGLTSGGVAAAHALLRYAALGGAAYSWVKAALNPADPLVWALAAGLSVGLWLLARGLQPVNKLSVLSDAAAAERLGSKHLAEQLRAEASAFFKPRVKAEDILRLHLPPGPGAAADSLSPRSAAIAAAAAAASASVVHVLVGYRHAAEIAWRLARPEGPTGGPSRDQSRSQVF